MYVTGAGHRPIRIQERGVHLRNLPPCFLSEDVADQKAHSVEQPGCTHVAERLCLVSGFHFDGDNGFGGSSESNGGEASAGTGFKHAPVSKSLRDARREAPIDSHDKGPLVSDEVGAELRSNGYSVHDANRVSNPYSS